MDKIADAFSLIRNGANIKQGLDDSGYPITRIETISNRTVDRDKMGYAGITDITKYSDYVLQDGDILMSHINSETHLGKVARYEKYEGETIIHGMNLLCLRPNKNLVDSRYAFYYLSSEAFLHQIPRITKKSVNQASFNVAALKELTFPIFSMEVQQPVADILDKANELIALRKEQLAKLDELVKARFVELFGTCAKLKRLEEYASLITKGASPKWQGVDYCEEGVLFVTSENVREGYLDFSKRKYLDDKINEIQPRSMLKRNDILINIVGASIGRAAVYNCDEIANINQAVALVRVDYSRINQTYLMTYLNSAQAIEMYGKIKKGGARDNLSLQNIADLQIPVASMELQEQFAAFVKQTDKSKLAIQQSLDKLELLKKALMQKYFG